MSFFFQFYSDLIRIFVGSNLTFELLSKHLNFNTIMFLDKNLKRKNV